MWQSSEKNSTRIFTRLARISHYCHACHLLHPLIFFAYGKKLKELLGIMCLGDGVGRSIDFPSVCPSVHDAVSATITGDTDDMSAVGVPPQTIMKLFHKF